MQHSPTDADPFCATTVLPEHGPARRDAPTLTIVIPCYNEEEMMPGLLARLDRLGEDLAAAGRIKAPMRLLMVDDGSSDRTWDLICDAARTRPLTAVKLSCNQGHQAALLAGLMQAETEVVVSMDADLQDDPEAVAPMIEAWQRGAEIVYGVRASRAKDTMFKRLTARTYYRTLRWLGADIIPDHADYRLMSRRALQSLAAFGERNLFLRGLVRKLGYRTEIVTYDRAPRATGESKYPLRKMISLALEGITSLSVKPLHLITISGFIIAGGAFAAVVWALAGWMMGRTIPGWASTVLPIYFLGGAHLTALGIIGEYVGKIYMETKARPRYIIDEVRLPQSRGVQVGAGARASRLDSRRTRTAQREAVPAKVAP